MFKYLSAFVAQIWTIFVPARLRWALVDWACALSELRVRARAAFFYWLVVRRRDPFGHARAPLAVRVRRPAVGASVHLTGDERGGRDRRLLGYFWGRHPVQSYAALCDLLAADGALRSPEASGLVGWAAGSGGPGSPLDAVGDALLAVRVDIQKRRLEIRHNGVLYVMSVTSLQDDLSIENIITRFCRLRPDLGVLEDVRNRRQETPI